MLSMQMKFTTGEGVSIEADSVLDALNRGRVMSIKPVNDGTFVATDSCDDWFSVNLTRDQLLQLAEEIRALAG